MAEREKNYAYELCMLILSVYALGALAFDAFVKPGPEVRKIVQYSDLIVCLFFFLDFCRNLYLADSKWRYLHTWGWLDLLSSIPMLDAFRLGRLARIIRVFRVLRGIRATKHVATYLLARRARGGVVTALLVAFVLIIFSSVAMLSFEDVAGANIKTAEDSLWWAIATITTVGYGDHYPISVEGRLVAAVLMTAGVGLFGTLSGLIASWFLKAESEQNTDEIEALRQEIISLRQAIERHPGFPS